MKGGYLFGTIVVALVLFAVWFSVGSSSGPTKIQSNAVLRDVSPNSVKGLVIHSSEDQVTLKLSDSGWVLPQRDNYPADANKVRSLLLKLFDLGSTQRLPSQEKTFAKLGVAKDSVAEGYARIDILAASETPEATVLFGKSRETEGSQATGQYVRREGEDSVLLVSTPIMVEPEVAAWLETQIINVRESAVYSIDQYTIEGGERTHGFSFKRSLQDEGYWDSLSLTDPEVGDKPLEESVLTQVRAGLENLRLTDVKTASELEGESFDRETVFKLVSGIEYTIATRKEGDSYLMRVRVDRPDSLVSELAALGVKSEELRATAAAKKATGSTNDEAAKAPESVEGESTQGESQTTELLPSDDDSTTEADAGEEAGQDETDPQESSPQEDSAEQAVEKDAADKDSPVKPIEPLISLSDANELPKLQQRFEKWLYVVPEFQANKYRLIAEDLFQKAVAEE